MAGDPRIESMILLRGIRWLEKGVAETVFRRGCPPLYLSHSSLVLLFFVAWISNVEGCGLLADG